MQAQRNSSRNAGNATSATPTEKRQSPSRRKGRIPSSSHARRPKTGEFEFEFHPSVPPSSPPILQPAAPPANGPHIGCMRTGFRTFNPGTGSFDMDGSMTAQQKVIESTYETFSLDPVHEPPSSEYDSEPVRLHPVRGCKSGAGEQRVEVVDVEEKSEDPEMEENIRARYSPSLDRMSSPEHLYNGSSFPPIYAANLPPFPSLDSFASLEQQSYNQLYPVYSGPYQGQIDLSLADSSWELPNEDTTYSMLAGYQGHESYWYRS